MKVYHGSYMIVDHPDILHSRRNVDFGPGFYTTPLYEQAKKWCQRFLRERRTAFVSIYTLDETALEVCKTLTFETYSEEWLDFIMTCRRGTDTSDYEIVSGGVANDKVFDTLELFFQGLINKSEAIGRLKYEKPNGQICFRSQEVIDRFLRFEGSERL